MFYTSLYIYITEIHTNQTIRKVSITGRLFLYFVHKKDKLTNTNKQKCGLNKPG